MTSQKFEGLHMLCSKICCSKWQYKFEGVSLQNKGKRNTKLKCWRKGHFEKKKNQFSDYFEHRIGIKSLSGYLEQVESWTILC